jgi:hypothetical protein
MIARLRMASPILQKNCYLAFRGMMSKNLPSRPIAWVTITKHSPHGIVPDQDFQNAPYKKTLGELLDMAAGVRRLCNANYGADSVRRFARHG